MVLNITLETTHVRGVSNCATDGSITTYNVDVLKFALLDSKSIKHLLSFSPLPHFKSIQHYRDKLQFCNSYTHTATIYLSTNHLCPTKPVTASKCDVN